MKIMFLTTQIQLCIKIGKHLAKKGHTYFLSRDILSLSKTLQEENKDFDLIACDLRLQPSDFSIQEILQNTTGKTIPVIFYNDLHASKSQRPWYWLKQNFKTISSVKKNPENSKNDFNFENYNLEYSKLFFDINNLIEEKDIFEEAFNFAKNQNQDKTAEEKPKIKLPPSLSKLFNYFYENKGKTINSTEIGEALFDKGSEKKDTVYTYISRLKKEKAFNTRFEIVNLRKGNYLLQEK